MGDQLSLVGETAAGRRLSATSLVMLRRCPRQFSFCEIEGNVRRAPEGGLAGAATHRALQTGAADLPARYAERRLVASELPIRLRRAGFVIGGRIDAVFAGAKEDDWELVDWKSGAAPAGGDPARDAQLEVYALAAVSDYGRRPEQVRTTYFYLATGECQTTAWSAQTVAAAEERLRCDLERISAGDFPAWPNHTCGTCDALPVCPEGLASV